MYVGSNSLGLGVKGRFEAVPPSDHYTLGLHCVSSFLETIDLFSFLV